MLTQLRFAEDRDIFRKEVPYEVFGYPTPTSERITNCLFEDIDRVKIEDVRDSPEQRYSLDTTGFTYIHHHSQCELDSKYFEKAGSSVENNPTVLAYLDETIQLVKDQINAKKVICFDWRVGVFCYFLRFIWFLVDRSQAAPRTGNVELQLTLHSPFSGKVSASGGT